MQDYMMSCMRIVTHKSVLDDFPVTKIAFSLLLLLISQVEIRHFIKHSAL